MEYRSQAPRVLLIKVTGSVEGFIYGADLYTNDSSFSAAAVHAGVLKPGETAG